MIWAGAAILSLVLTDAYGSSAFSNVSFVRPTLLRLSVSRLSQHFQFSRYSRFFCSTNETGTNPTVERINSLFAGPGSNEAIAATAALKFKVTRTPQDAETGTVYRDHNQQYNRTLATVKLQNKERHGM